MDQDTDILLARSDALVERSKVSERRAKILNRRLAALSRQSKALIDAASRFAPLAIAIYSPKNHSLPIKL